MATFVYQYLDEAGGIRSARMDAETEESALARLREAGYRVVGVRRSAAGAFLSGFGRRLTKVRLRDVAIFTRQFAVMIGAGVPVLRCLETIQSATRSARLTEVIEGVKNDVRTGQSLTDALYRHRPVFSDLYVNMVRAAELGGILDIVLNRLAAYLEKEMEINGKIKSALTYPAVVFVFSIMAVCFIVFYVMPQFQPVFKDWETPLPWTTRFLLNSSSFLLRYWYIPLSVIVGLFVAFRVYASTQTGRYNIDALKLRVPVFGTLLRKISVARFARTFATLIASGMPVLRVLEIVADTAGNKVIQSAILKARNSVQEGQRISDPLAASGVFPVLLTQMVSVGEETGQLDTMLEKVSDFYDREVDDAVASLTAMIEPIMIIGLGAIVAFIALSVITPIYDIASAAIKG
jgi:type IV pilus assembly protein PilC